MIGLVLAAGAQAGTLGLGVGAAVDLPDPGSSNPRTYYLPAVDLVVPYRLELAPRAALRIQGHGSFAKGKDLLSWNMPGDVGPVTEQASTYAGQLGLSVGPEIRFDDPSGTRSVVPYLAGDLGLTLVNNWHTDLRRPELFDPAFYSPEDLDNQRKISPYTRQLVPATGLSVGVHAGRVWSELGYEMMFVQAHDLRHGTPSIEPHREAYGWNAVRLVVGLDLGAHRLLAPPEHPPASGGG